MPGSKLQGYSLFRTFGNYIYDFIYAFATNRIIYDLGSGLKMYSVEMLKDRFYLKFYDNLMFDCCMLLASDYYKHDIKFFPISWREDDQVSNVKLFSQGIKTLKLAWDYINKNDLIKGEYREKIIDDYSAEVVCEWI